MKYSLFESLRLAGLAMGWAAILVLPPPAAAADAFTDAKMTEIKLDGLRVRLGEPILVAAQLAWPEGPNGRWVMNHPVPAIARFPSGDLLVTYSLVADYNDDPRNVSGMQFSRDGGRTWSERYDFVAEHQSMIYVPEGDSSLMGIPAYLHPQSPSDDRNFYSAYTLLENGGRRVIIEPRGVKVVDWPWPVAKDTYFGFFADKAVPGIVPARPFEDLCFDGAAIRIGGELLATAYGMIKGESQWRSVIMVSKDDGRIWRYLSTVADATGLPPAIEGPNEISMVQLADGDLMAVYRVNGGREWKLRRAYSHDSGRSWSKSDVLPAYSVEPRLLRVHNGTLVLSTGRPGIRLWLSTDPRGRTWQDVDIVAHHNRWAPDSSYRISAYGKDRWKTTSYTNMVEISPNHFLLVYDRGAEPKPENMADLTRIFVLPVEVERE